MLEDNFNILQQRFPHVAERMDHIQQTGIDSIAFVDTLERDELWIQAVSQIIGNSKIIFVYGFDDGFGIADLIDLFPNRWFVVYEPDEQQFYNAIHQYDLSLLLNHPNLYWLSVGGKQLDLAFNVLCSYLQETTVFIAQRKYLLDDMTELRNVKHKFEEHKLTFFANKLTENRFREDWTRNFLYHLKDSLSTPSIERLVGTFDGKTAIIVSSGPSLNEDIEWIKRLQSHVLIIAAGSSVQALVKNNIYPHLCVIMDGHPVNNLIYSSDETLVAPLLFTTSSYYEISDRKTSHKIHSVMKSDAITQYVLGLTQQQVLIHPTPTVAGIAVQAAACLGCTKILLAGQDLSFPNNTLYSDGVTHFSEEIKAGIAQKATQQVLNVKGSYNLTDDSFLIMKSTLENLIAVLPKIQFINTSRHGADIEGAPFHRLDELFDQLVVDHIDDNAIGACLDRLDFSIDFEAVDQVKAKLAFLITDLASTSEELRKVKRLLSNFREYSRTKPAKAIKTYEEIERRWGEIANREWFAPLLESIIPIEVIRFDQRLPNIVHELELIRKSDLLYEYLGEFAVDIERQIPLLQQYIEEAIDRTDELTINQ